MIQKSIGRFCAEIGGEACGSRQELSDTLPAADGPLAAARRFRQHLLDLDRDPIAVDQHDAAGNRQVVGQHLDLVGLGGVELDDGAAGQPQHLVNGHGCGPEDHHEIDGDFIEGWHFKTAELGLNCASP